MASENVVRNSQIREAWKAGERAVDIAHRFGISKQRVDQILKTRKDAPVMAIESKVSYAEPIQVSMPLTQGQVYLTVPRLLNMDDVEIVEEFLRITMGVLRKMAAKNPPPSAEIPTAPPTENLSVNPLGESHKGTPANAPEGGES